MGLHKGPRYQKDMSRQELIEIVFGCTLAAVLVGHIIINGEKPSVDSHCLTLSIMTGFFAGIAFNRPVVMMIREWRAKGRTEEGDEDHEE